MRISPRRGGLLLLLLVPGLLLAACGASVAVCGDWWCVGGPIDPWCDFDDCFYDVASLDVNGDGIQDAVYANEQRVGVRLGDGNGGVGAESSFAVGLGRVDLARAADVDGNGDVDLILIDALTPALQVLLGDGAGGLGTQGPVVPLTGASRIVDAQVGRVDGGTLDDLVALDDAGGVLAALGAAGGAMTLAPAGRQALACGGTALDVGLIDGDTLADLAVTNRDGWNVCIYMGAGTGAFTPLGGTLPVTERPLQPLLANLDGAGGLDLLLLLRDGSLAQAWLGNGAGGFTPTSQGIIAAGVTGHTLLAVADPGAPADPVDVAVLGGGLLFGAVSILVNGDDGTFAVPAPVVTLPHPATAGVVTDLQMDGRADLIVLSAQGTSILTGGAAQD